MVLPVVRQATFKEWVSQVDENVQIMRARPEFQRQVQFLVKVLLFAILAAVSCGLLIYRHTPRLLAISELGSLRNRPQAMPGGAGHQGLVIEPPVDKVGDSAWIKLHESYVAAAVKQRPQVVFVGDSITEGFVGTSYGRRAPKYAKSRAVWDAMVGRMKVSSPVVNFGISGDRVGHVRWRLENGVLQNLNAPRILVLTIGVNDLLSGVEGNATARQIGRLVNFVLARNQRRTDVLLQAILPVGWKRVLDVLPAVNAMLRDVANKEGAQFLDCYDTFLRPDGTLNEDLYLDVLHLSEAGYKNWASCILSAAPWKS